MAYMVNDGENDNDNVAYYDDAYGDDDDDDGDDDELKGQNKQSKLA